MLSEMPYPGSGRSVSAELTDAIAKIGENMNLRRAATIEVNDGVVGSYVHNAVQARHGQARHHRRPRIDRRQGCAGRARQAARDAHRQHQSAVGVARRHRSGQWWPASARSSPSRPGNPASRPRSSTRWSRAGCASSTRKSRSWRRPSSSTARPRSPTSIKEAEKDVGAPIKVTSFVRYALGEGIDEGRDRLCGRSGRDRRRRPAAGACQVTF